MKSLNYLVWPLILVTLVNIDFSQKGLLKTIKEMPFCSEGVLDWNKNKIVDIGDVYFFSYDLDGDGIRKTASIHYIREIEYKRGRKKPLPYKQPFQIWKDTNKSGEYDTIWFRGDFEKQEPAKKSDIKIA